MADSVFGHIAEAPEDPILGLNSAFKADPCPNKLNLGVGAYRTEEGLPLVLSVVKKAEASLMEKGITKEYLPIDGLPEFLQGSARLVYGGDSEAIKEERIAIVQSLSGTGAIRLGSEFLHTFMPSAAVYIPIPTWANHIKIFRNAFVPTKTYRYLDSKTRGLDFAAMVEDIRNAPEGSVILLHACSHNPTGVDPTPEQWEALANILKEKKHFPFFDTAYQGFATGSLDNDAMSIRMFVKRGFELFTAQSYAKNMGLYGERAGTFSVVCKNKRLAVIVKSQLKGVIRPMYSNPPQHGALIVATVLNTPELYQEWLGELDMMSGRIKKMRKLLYDKLIELKTPGDWSHVVKQIGMFSYTGLAEQQVSRLVNEYHIYMTSDGRISMAGLNTKNVATLANAMHDVVSATTSSL